MKEKWMAVAVALVVVTLILPVFAGGGKAVAENVNIMPYFVAGNVADYWTYTYAYPSGLPDFTVNLTLVTSGPFTGKYQIGNSTEWEIADWDASGIYVYAVGSTVYDPPVVINAVQPLDAVVESPFSEDACCPWYFQKLGSSLTVPAGVFDDVLVQIVLDKNFGPTSANALFGLDPSIPYGVTHVSWMAAGIGEIQNRDYIEGGSSPFEYQLQATSVPVPASLVLLGWGLLGLATLRSRFPH